MTINTAVIGCGSWGRNHARVYRSLPGANLLAVADAHEPTAREIGELHRVTYYSDPEQIMRDPDIQVVRHLHTHYHTLRPRHQSHRRGKTRTSRKTND